jgi:hypothetical protein
MSAADGALSPKTEDPQTSRSEARQPITGQVRHVTDLIPHPHLVKHSKGYTTQELTTLSGRGEAAFADPITITHENVIVEGYALWQLAILRQRKTLTCIVRHMDQETAMLHLLDKNRGSKGIRDFARILMALELEPWFRDHAKSNQRIGGRDKGSTQLTEADRLDVREEVARAAGVSAGNVSKVKQIQQSAILQIREAVLAGEIQINRAAVWSRSPPSTQERRLSDYRNEHGIRRTIAVLLRKHQDRYPILREGLREVQRGLRSLHTDPHLSSVFASLSAVIQEIDEVLNPDEVSRAA